MAFADGLSSAALKARPSAGSTPRVGNKSHEHAAACTFSGSCPLAPDRLYSSELETIAKSEKPWLWSFQAANIPPATMLNGNASSELCSYNRISRSGSLNGSGFNSTDRTTVNSATFAPIPMAMTRIEMQAKPGVLASVRTPIRIFCRTISTPLQLHVSRVCSRSSVGLPKARRAA